MRRKFDRINSVGYHTGSLLQILAIIMLIPALFPLIYWGKHNEGVRTLFAFLTSSAISFLVGSILHRFCKEGDLDATGSMLVCATGWFAAAAMGGLPFVIGLGCSYIDGCFEAMSGFSTTGFTMFPHLEILPRSMLFWRALMQFVGGLGILSFFLAITFRGGGSHHLFGAEGHKIASARPAPGLFNTLKILWCIYLALTVLCGITLLLQGMSPFDTLCHSLTTVSTGGFSPHDTSLGYYGELVGGLPRHPNFRLFEYTVAVFMMLGGVNFLIHFRIWSGDSRALWDNLEIRWYWGIIFGYTGLAMIDHIGHNPDFQWSFSELEQCFRHSIFQVVSLITSTGFTTRPLTDSYFPALTRQLFMVLMIVGGCVGSTSGGFKVMRVAILNRLIMLEVFKLRVSHHTTTALVVDNKIVSDEEIRRVGALFFTWMALALAGGTVTALFSHLGPWESFSGMFSALGNMGPCYISNSEIIELNPVVKVTYIFGMLAGRLEILPVLLLFSRKAWTH